jgi:hypothetical protein
MKKANKRTIVIENFQKLMTDSEPQIKKAHRTPSRIHIKKIQLSKS